MGIVKKFFLIAVIFIYISLLSCLKTDSPGLRDGDIIFQISTSSQSKAIQLATHSRYSHMGIIFKVKNNLYVYEAGSTVKHTPLKKWIERGDKGHFVVKRLKNADEILTKINIDKIIKTALKFKGKKYDLYFRWSDDKIYCSELVWKIYKRALGIEVGRLKRFKDFDMTHSIVKTKLKQRYGNNLPMDEIIISPQAVFESDLLKTIMSEKSKAYSLINNKKIFS